MSSANFINPQQIFESIESRINRTLTESEQGKVFEIVTKINEDYNALGVIYTSLAENEKSFLLENLLILSQNFMSPHFKIIYDGVMNDLSKNDITIGNREYSKVTNGLLALNSAFDALKSVMIDSIGRPVESETSTAFHHSQTEFAARNRFLSQHEENVTPPLVQQVQVQIQEQSQSCVVQ